MIFLPEVVTIVGRHQGNAGLSGDGRYLRQDRCLGFNSVILHFQVEIPFTENLMQFPSSGYGGIDIPLHQMPVDLTLKT